MRNFLRGIPWETELRDKNVQVMIDFVIQKCQEAAAAPQPHQEENSSEGTSVEAPKGENRYTENDKVCEELNKRLQVFTIEQEEAHALYEEAANQATLEEFNLTSDELKRRTTTTADTPKDAPQTTTTADTPKDAPQTTTTADTPKDAPQTTTTADTQTTMRAVNNIKKAGILATQDEDVCTSSDDNVYDEDFSGVTP
ncbi:myb-like protein X [Procambarus clarkii]|uniref:myb-like protein X n=1 Tax=Procambarus clarkii TaxID=6728 RepID=UPI0037445E81